MSQCETEVTEGLSSLGGLYAGERSGVLVTVSNVSFDPGVRNGAKALTWNHDRLIASHIVVTVGAVEWLEPVEDVVYTEIHK